METVSTPRADRRRIVQARAEAGLTQAELALKAGCSVVSIGKYERGERALRGPRLRRIAEATGKPLSFFFTTGEEAVA
jgi:transcriptional regulator with XRE-family HTH domain